MARLSERTRLWFERYTERLAERREAEGGHERHRVWAMVLSVVIAGVLWFTFSLREQYAITVEMPVEVGAMPEGRALRALPPLVARVTLQGEGSQLLTLRRRPPTLVIPSPEDEVDLFSVASESPRIPPGVSVQSVFPPTVSLDLEAAMQRALPVRLRGTIEPAPLYDLLGPPTLDPDTVVVSGARSIVGRLDAFPTAPLSRDDVRESFSVELPLSDTLQGLVRTSVASVEVTASVGLFTEAQRELTLRVEGAPPGAAPVTLRPGRVTVTYRIPVEQFDAAQEEAEFYAFVPYATVVNDTTGAVRPVLHLPRGLAVRDAEVEPRRLRYFLRID